MCNEHRRTVELGRISDAFAQLRIPLRFPEGAPNLAALESIRFTDPTAIVRAAPGADEEGERPAPGAADLDRAGRARPRCGALS